MIVLAVFLILILLIRWSPDFRDRVACVSQATAGIGGLTRSPRPDTGKLKPCQGSRLRAALACR